MRTLVLLLLLTCFIMPVRVLLIFIYEDTHALVRFLEEDSTAIIPIHRIRAKETLEYGGSCTVLWSNKKVYKAFLISSGIQNCIYTNMAN